MRRRPVLQVKQKMNMKLGVSLAFCPVPKVLRAAATALDETWEIVRS